ncbi:unnamed protein product [Microthlaspi erraticum]|uniref:Uncharacterized protein n=1 Tax=Microthlaspi erraticum TaxID=1685480 RepID=A0A6D2KL74_9BRAS|nr:unnamed protein product [Microthlaspi erraticum]
MSKRIADNIGLTKIEPSSISINYADSFSQTPYGFVPNVMVQIGNCSIPTDFQIVEMRESSIDLSYLEPLSCLLWVPYLISPIKESLSTRNIKEDPIPKPKQLAKQARSKTKAPTPKPPKGSTKIEDEAKPRKKVRKPRSGRNMKLLFPKELIDENLEGFKEKVTRTLKLFPKAVVPRDIHGEIVYPAVNHPPDTHCKEKRLGGSKMPLVSIFS